MQYTDQTGYAIELPSIPTRIVSLVPSQTELLVDLGLADYLVGITKFCVHPATLRSQKTIVGGTKQLHLERIVALKPDLIIGNKEENTRQDIEWLRERYPVWMSEIIKMTDALHMIEQIGHITSRSAQAQVLSQNIESRFSAYKYTFRKPLSAAYFIWQSPLMGVGGSTFIDDMLTKAGFVNALSAYQRYPTLDAQALQAAAPEVILLSSEPYPFGHQHFDWFKHQCPTAVIRLVDGEAFSWYGSRLLESPTYFAQLAQSLQADFGVS